MKDQAEVVREFNELVNMSASDLESWLKSGDSRSAGWPKSDGTADGETVGHNSGRKIVEILKSNPKQDPEGYTENQVAHMRKVVAYCKRHLAQESAGNEEKSPEELQKTKSYASLKNWGHDFLKAREADDAGKKNVTPSKDRTQSNGKKRGAKRTRQTDDNIDPEEDGDEEEPEDPAEDVNDDPDDGEDEGEAEENGEATEESKVAGTKRKKTSTANSANKRHETRKGAATKSSSQNDDKNDENEGEQGSDDENVDNGEEADEPDDSDDTENEVAKKPKKGPSKGDTVSWNWGGGQPQGKVLDVKGEKTTITTKRGNEVSRNGKPDDPAVVLDAGSSKAIKLAHELN